MLSEILHKIASMEDQERGEHEYRPRPSLAGPERCIRQMVYWARGEEKRPLPGRAVVVMSDSAWHETLTADLIRKGAFQVHSEQMPVTIPGAFNWLNGQPALECAMCHRTIAADDCHGHLDFIVTDLLGNDVVVEMKALSHFSFEGLHRGDELPLDYLTQLAIYLRGVQQDQPDLTQGLLLVKNKNQSGYLEFRCEYDSVTDTLTVLERVHHTGERVEIGQKIESITANAFKKFETVDSYVFNEELPPRPYEIDSWRCDYCPYNETCWAGWEDEHLRLDTDVDLHDLDDTIRYARELKAQRDEIDTQYENVRGEVKLALQLRNIRSGRTKEYVVEWKVGPVRRLDVNRLPPQVREAATVPHTEERLVIRKIRKKEKSNDKTIHADKRPVASS